MEYIQANRARLLLMQEMDALFAAVDVYVTPSLAGNNLLATNLTGLYAMSKACLRGMMKARWGRIVNIASVVGVSGASVSSAWAEVSVEGGCSVSSSSRRLVSSCPISSISVRISGGVLIPFWAFCS